LLIADYLILIMISQLSYHKRGRDVKIERFPSTPTRAAFTTLHEERLASALAAAKATVRASVMAEAAVAAAKAADAAKAAEVALEKAEADLAAAEAAEATARAAEAALAVIDKPRWSAKKRATFAGPIAMSASVDV
jgi:poly-gamma-glutamate capsule biosynthesis protein CapA/YwtB (metallophosphatase superfamily)